MPFARKLSLGLALLYSGAAGAQSVRTTTPPGPGAPTKYSVPAVQTMTLPNGVKIALMERHTLPIVSARIQLDAGAVREAADKSGVAVLTASLLSEGTDKLTSAQFAEKMADLGASFGAGAGFGSAAASVNSLSNVFAPALALAATAVVRPRLDQMDFNRVRAASIAGFERGQSTVSGIASRIFPMAVYDPATPYARLSGGTKATLSSLTLNDVRNWHNTMYSPANTTVLIVGDVTPAGARKAVEAALGGWSAPAPSFAPLANKARQVSGNRVVLVDRPGSVQSYLQIGQAIPGFGSADYYPLLAGVRVLGGSGTARLNMNLREKHGWTYNSYAAFSPQMGVGSTFMYSEVRTNATDSATAEMVREYRRLVTDPVPAAELKDQMDNVISGFPSSVQTVQGLMGRLETIVTYGLPLDFYSTYRNRLAQLSSGDIARVGKSVLTPNDLSIVIVGDLKSIEAPVRALNLGTVEVWDVDGNKLR